MIDYYELNAERYFEVTAYVDSAAFLTPLLKHLKREATVLDVGCGSGRDLLWLSRRGFSPFGLERSSKLANLARQFSGCPVIEADLLTYDFSQHQVDALLLIGSLCHLEHGQVANVLISIIRAVKTGGHLFISLKEGTAKEIDADGREFYLWNSASLEEIFNRMGLTILDFTRQYSRLRNSDVWLGYLLQKGSTR